MSNKTIEKGNIKKKSRMQEDNAYRKWDGELGGESRNFQQHIGTKKKLE